MCWGEHFLCVDKAFSFFKKENYFLGFPDGLVVKTLPTNAGDMGFNPGPGKSHMLWSN